METIRTSAFGTDASVALVIPGYEPYKIPKNWCWIDLLSAFENCTDSKKKIQQKDYNESGEFAIVDQGKELIGGYTNDASQIYNGHLPVIIFGDHTRCIKYIDFPFAQGADGVKVLKPQSFYNPKCFYYALQSIEMPNLGYRRHYPLFDKFSIPLPPLPEQLRIVERIEKLFSKLDEAKEKAQEILDAFEVRKASILHKAFTGELTTEWRKENGITGNAYSKRRFDEVAEIKSNLVDPADYQNYPHIAPDNIEKKTGVLLDYHTIEEDGVKSGKHLFYPGQILYSKIRPNLSKIVVVDFKGLCSADMYPIEAKGDAKCLWYYMLSEEFLEQASSAGSRSVLPKINQKELSRLKVSLPASIDEQREISRILDTLLDRELQSKQTAEMVINQIDIMKKSILARAFRGELGTNNPNDENAEELLKRILSEKAKEEKEQPKVKRTRIVIPEEIENLLQTNLEREIIKLFYKSEIQEVSAEDILSVSSKTFDVLEAIRVLENKKIIKKTKRNFYKIAR